MIRQLSRSSNRLRLVQRHCLSSSQSVEHKINGNDNTDDENEEFDIEDLFDHDDYTSYLPPPWQSILGPPARASWRVSSIRPPQALAQAQFDLIQDSGRTSKQLKRTHQRILQTHTQLAQRRERERKRLKQLRKGKDIKDSLAFKEERNQDTDANPVFYQPEYSLASVQQRLLPNYAIVQRVLREIQGFLPDFQPVRVLDFGYGGGSSSMAAIDVFSTEKGTTIQWIHGVEPSQSMRDCATQIFDGVVTEEFPNHPPRLTLTTTLATDTAAATANFDLAMMNYTALELPHVASTLAAAASLWEKLKVGGIFVMVEPGIPDGFNSIRSVRSMLLDCCPAGSEDECHILAPCTHNRQCPMERHRVARGKQNDSNEEGPASLGSISQTSVFDSAFCSFVHNIPGSHSRNKGEKLSYLVAQKRNPEYRSEPLKAIPNIRDLLAECYQRDREDEKTADELAVRAQQVQMHLRFDSQRAVNDNNILDVLVGDRHRHSFGRIIRAPIKRKGHVLLDYCAGGGGNGDDDEGEPKGHIVRHRMGKQATNRIAPGMYSAARKARWGGLWPDLIDHVGGAVEIVTDEDLEEVLEREE